MPPSLDHLASSPPTSDVRFYRLVGRLCRCGERPVAELLAELCRERMLRDVIETKLERYIEALARLGPDVLRVLGCDRAPPLPLIKVPEM
jgi:hypothetical protein